MSPKRRTSQTAMKKDRTRRRRGRGSSSTAAPAPPVQKITISGSEPLPRSLHTNLPSLVSHDAASLSSAAGKPLLKALVAAHIRSLWGVQTAVGGCILEDKDVMCIAPTGSGKTLSYVLPTLVRLRDPARSLKGKREGRGVRALILVPTHDLPFRSRSRQGRDARSALALHDLDQATEKAVCESCPGANHSTMKTARTAREMKRKTRVRKRTYRGRKQQHVDAGIDFLIATPERLHHLLESKALSLEGKSFNSSSGLV